MDRLVPGPATGLLHWAGCQLQPTHRPVIELGYRPTTEDGRPLDVFISRWYHGSPAQRYGLYALNWVDSVNGEPTPDLDTFIRVVQGLEDGRGEGASHPSIAVSALYFSRHIPATT